MRYFSYQGKIKEGTEEGSFKLFSENNSNNYTAKIWLIFYLIQVTGKTYLVFCLNLQIDDDGLFQY